MKLFLLSNLLKFCTDVTAEGLDRLPSDSASEASQDTAAGLGMSSSTSYRMRRSRFQGLYNLKFKFPLLGQI